MNNAALILACETYKDCSFQPLYGVRRDAENMLRVLTEKCGCSEVQILGDTDERPATGHGIMEAVIKTRSSAKIDNFYLFYSGHGFMDADEEVFLLPSDVIRINDFEIFGMSSLRQLLNLINNRIQPKSVFVFLDMCLTSASAKAVGNTDNAYLHKGAVVFYSTLPHAKSYVARDHSGSYFTTCLVNLLSGDDRLTAGELSQKLEEEMKLLCEKDGLKQIPHTMCLDTVLLNRFVNFPNGEQDFFKEKPEESQGISNIEQILHQEFRDKVELTDAERTALESFAKQLQYSATDRRDIEQVGSVGEKGWYDYRKYILENLSSVKNKLEEIGLYRETLLEIKQGPKPSVSAFSRLFRLSGTQEESMPKRFSEANDGLGAVLVELDRSALNLSKVEARLQELLRELAMYIISVNLALGDFTASLRPALNQRLGQLRTRRKIILEIYDWLQSYTSMLQDYRAALTDAVNVPFDLDVRDEDPDLSDESLSLAISRNLELLSERKTDELTKQTDSLVTLLLS